MRVCVTQVQPILAASKSDPYKTYEVILRPADSTYPKCTCIAFAMNRNKLRKGLAGQNVDVEATCKHIREVLRTACDWGGQDDRNYSNCPSCGAETIEAGSSVPLPTVTLPPMPAPTTGMPELRPMLAHEVAAEKMGTYVEDTNYWMQQKVDGHRVLVHVHDGNLMVLGRGGQASQHGSRFAQPHYKDILRLPDCVVDGELIGNVFWIFDLPHCDKLGVTIDSPYSERYEALQTLFSVWTPNDAYRLLPTAKSQMEKAELAVTCFRSGGEGLIVRELAGTYKPGARVSSVLKLKFVKTADVVVSAVGVGGKENYALSVFRDGDLVEIGHCSAIGKAVVPVGTVIEVKYLNLAANERLFQPRMLTVRTDKHPTECLFSQFDHARVNKDVIDGG